MPVSPQKNQNIWPRESKVRPFTPRFPVTLEKGGVNALGFPYNLIDKIL